MKEYLLLNIAGRKIKLVLNRLKLNYKDIKEGDGWEKMGNWFELSIKIPSDWEGKTLATNLDFSGEGLVYDSKGNEIQGITNGAIWDPNFARTRVIINQKLILNQTLTIWVEYSKSTFGVSTDPDGDPKHGWFDAKLKNATRFLMLNYGIYI